MNRFGGCTDKPVCIPVCVSVVTNITLVSFPIFFVVLLHLTVSCNYYCTFAGGMVQLIYRLTCKLNHYSCGSCGRSSLLWMIWLLDTNGLPHTLNAKLLVCKSKIREYGSLAYSCSIHSEYV